MFLLDLPNELLISITSFMPVSDIEKLSLISKSFNFFVKNNTKHIFDVITKGVVQRIDQTMFKPKGLDYRDLPILTKINKYESIGQPLTVVVDEHSTRVKLDNKTYFIGPFKFITIGIYGYLHLDMFQGSSELKEGHVIPQLDETFLIKRLPTDRDTISEYLDKHNILEPSSGVQVAPTMEGEAIKLRKEQNNIIIDNNYRYHHSLINILKNHYYTTLRKIIKDNGLSNKITFITREGPDTIVIEITSFRTISYKRYNKKDDTITEFRLKIKDDIINTDLTKENYKAMLSTWSQVENLIKSRDVDFITITQGKYKLDYNRTTDTFESFDPQQYDNEHTFEPTITDPLIDGIQLHGVYNLNTISTENESYDVNGKYQRLLLRQGTIMINGKGYKLTQKFKIHNRNVSNYIPGNKVASYMGSIETHGFKEIPLIANLNLVPEKYEEERQIDNISIHYNDNGGINIIKLGWNQSFKFTPEGDSAYTSDQYTTASINSRTSNLPLSSQLTMPNLFPSPTVTTTTTFPQPVPTFQPPTIRSTTTFPPTCSYFPISYYSSYYFPSTCSCFSTYIYSSYYYFSSTCFHLSSTYYYFSST